MRDHSLLLIDFTSITLLGIHLTDVDTALKIIASLTVIYININALYKKRKSK